MAILTFDQLMEAGPAAVAAMPAQWHLANPAVAGTSARAFINNSVKYKRGDSTRTMVKEQYRFIEPLRKASGPIRLVITPGLAAKEEVPNLKAAVGFNPATDEYHLVEHIADTLVRIASELDDQTGVEFHFDELSEFLGGLPPFDGKLFVDADFNLSMHTLMSRDIWPSLVRNLGPHHKAATQMFLGFTASHRSGPVPNRELLKPYQDNLLNGLLADLKSAGMNPLKVGLPSASKAVSRFTFQLK